MNVVYKKMYFIYKYTFYKGDKASVHVHCARPIPQAQSLKIEFQEQS